MDSKAPAEIIPVTFNFKRLLSTPIDNVTVSISVIRGTDENVSSMLLGSYQLNGFVITQLIRNGVDGVKYLIRVDAASGNLKFSLGAYMMAKELS